MTQEYLQRDVMALEHLRLACLVDAKRTRNPDVEARLRIESAALDRALETARVLASVSGDMRCYLIEHHERMSSSFASLPGGGGSALDRADAHRKVARLMGQR